MQRVRGDVREKGLNALRQLVDEVDAGRFPGLYLVITGTPAFFDGPQGVRRLPPLAQRLPPTSATDARFDNPRAVQIRLPGFDLDRLVEVGPAGPRPLRRQARATRDRIRPLVDDAYVAELAGRVTGELGGPGRRRAAAVPQEAGRRRARPGRPVSPTSTRARTTRLTVADERADRRRARRPRPRRPRRVDDDRAGPP